VPQLHLNPLLTAKAWSTNVFQLKPIIKTRRWKFCATSYRFCFRGQQNMNAASLRMRVRAPGESLALWPLLSFSQAFSRTISAGSVDHSTVRILPESGDDVEGRDSSRTTVCATLSPSGGAIQRPFRARWIAARPTGRDAQCRDHSRSIRAFCDPLVHHAAWLGRRRHELAKDQWREAANRRTVQNGTNGILTAGRFLLRTATTPNDHHCGPQRMVPG